MHSSNEHMRRYAARVHREDAVRYLTRAADCLEDAGEMSEAMVIRGRIARIQSKGLALGEAITLGVHNAG